MADEYDDDERRPRRRRRGEDDDDEPPRRRSRRWAEDGEDDEPPFPATVMIAGVMWILVGGLALLSLVGNLALGGMRNNAPPGQTFGSVFAGLVGVAFLYCGYQSVSGQATDTRGNGRGSIAFGILYLLLAVFLFTTALGNGQAGPALLMAVLLFAFALFFITAGILALIGRDAYVEWRKSKYTIPRRRRPRRRDDWDD